MNSSTKDTFLKHSLGKFIIICLHIAWLYADDFDYKISVDKHQPYVKEAVLVSIEVKQSNHDIILLFDFDLKKSETYSFQRVGIQEVDDYHASQIRYTYLVYPLQAGKVNIQFKLIQKATSDESVAYSFSGDRDNVKSLVTRDTPIDLPPVIIDVKPLPKGTKLVGDFILDYQVNTHEAEAFEPLPLHISIQGKGYPPVLIDILPTSEHFTHFSETPFVHPYVNNKSEENKVSYAIALSSDTNFSLEDISINAFNPFTEKSYTLSIPKQSFTIHSIDNSTLVDSIDNPSPVTLDWSWFETFLSYLLVFFAGYLSAFSRKWNREKNSIENEHPVKEKIQASKTHKQLLQLLLSKDATYFSSPIKKLESTLYKEANISLHTIKQEAIERLK